VARWVPEHQYVDAVADWHKVVTELRATNVLYEKARKDVAELRSDLIVAQAYHTKHIDGCVIEKEKLRAECAMLRKTEAMVARELTAALFEAREGEAKARAPWHIKLCRACDLVVQRIRRG